MNSTHKKSDSAGIQKEKRRKGVKPNGCLGLQPDSDLKLVEYNSWKMVK